MWVEGGDIMVNVFWVMCVFGLCEVECVFSVVLFGGYVCLGFENNMVLFDGSMVFDNVVFVINL